MLVFFQIKAFSNAGLNPSCAAHLLISNVEPEEDILKGHYPIILSEPSLSSKLYVQ